jgi:hypothetical protein
LIRSLEKQRYFIHATTVGAGTEWEDVYLLGEPPLAGQR